MLEKSCKWWLICYLLFFCHGGAEGQLQWVVKEKVTAYGQNLILFCPVENCCSESAGWSVGSKSKILDVKTFSNDPKVKYHGTYNKDGFGIVIRNLSEADLHVTYRCVYGFDQSTPKYLRHGEVFRENVPEKDKEIDIAAIIIVVAIVVTIVVIGLIIGIVAYCVYNSRIKKKSTGTKEETEKINVSDIPMENKQGKTYIGTNEETEKNNVSDTPDEEVKCLTESENQQAQASVQVQPVSGTSGVEHTVYQQAQIAKITIPKKSNQSDVIDGVVVHAKEDKDAAEEFITNMRTENPNLDIKIKSCTNLMPGKSVLKSIDDVFDSHIFVFVFITENFLKAKLEQHCSEMSLHETFHGKDARLIPVKADTTIDMPKVLNPLIPLQYCEYLEAKKLGGSNQNFIDCFKNLIINGRKDCA